MILDPPTCHGKPCWPLLQPGHWYCTVLGHTIRYKTAALR